MKSITKRRLIILVAGMAIATFVSVFVTFAFFEVKAGMFIRNILITNAVFIALNMIWIRLHRNYEKFYKSGLEREEEK